MTARLRVKIGDVEVDFEGPESFLEKDYEALLSKACALYTGSVASSTPKRPLTREHSHVHSGSEIVGTTNSLAAKLSVKTGADLARAAAARLVLVLNKATFTRQELIAEMRAGTSYFKETYVNNLSATIAGLTKAQEFLESSTNVFSLKADAQEKLRQRLA